MSAGTASRLRTLAFGDVDGGLWGAAIDAADPVIVLGAGADDAVALPIDGGWTADDPGWRLCGDGFSLHVEPGGEEVTDDEEPALEDADAIITGFQELCRVQGTVTIGGHERTIDCVGTRCAIDGVDAGSLGSARAVAGWFAADDAFMLLALRSADADTHESDLVAATLFDPDGWVPVQDPRLSTTYSAAGEPARTSLELWVGDGEDEFPRRAAAEAAGPAASLTRAGLTLHVVPMRCHSRGQEGTGVYVLAAFTA